MRLEMPECGDEVDVCSRTRVSAPHRPLSLSTATPQPAEGLSNETGCFLPGRPRGFRIKPRKPPCVSGSASPGGWSSAQAPEVGLWASAFALTGLCSPRSPASGPIRNPPGQVGFALEVAFVGVSFSRALIWELPEGVRVGPGNTSRPPPRVDFDGKTLSRGGCQPLLCPLQWNPLSEGPCPADGPPPHLISSTKSTSRSECVSFLEARDL